MMYTIGLKKQSIHTYITTDVYPRSSFSLFEAWAVRANSLRVHPFLVFSQHIQELIASYVRA